MKRFIVQTRFYYDIQDTDHFVIVNQTKSVLRASDLKNGYVNRDWVIRQFGISHLRLTKRSCLVEYLVDINENGVLPVEKKIVYVR
jgi:hypothetical protein